MKGSSKESTLEHKKVVCDILNDFVVELLNRGSVHDNSKLEDPEVGLFDTYTPKLASSVYGSKEYIEFSRWS